jgi:Arc/MetJ-type ribon-helix-helix transcriptional regulator
MSSDTANTNPRRVRVGLPAAIVKRLDDYIIRGYFGSREEALRFALAIIDEEIGDRAVDLKTLAQLRAERARLRLRENPENVGR